MQTMWRKASCAQILGVWLKTGQIRKKTSFAYKIKIIDEFIKKKTTGSETGHN